MKAFSQFSKFEFGVVGICCQKMPQDFLLCTVKMNALYLIKTIVATDYKQYY